MTATIKADEIATTVIDAVLELAVTVRDEGPDEIRNAATAVLQAAADPVAALAIAAALIDVDTPVDTWWQRPHRARALKPHGTHAAHNRHINRGEPPCRRCASGEREYQAARHQRRRGSAS